VVDATGDAASMDLLSAGGATVLSGDDTLAARAGGRHLVSAAACAVPELMAALDRAVKAGAQDEIQTLDRALHEFLRWAARFPEPAAVKLATGLRGLKTGPLAVPLAPEKQKELDAFRNWFQGWLPSVRKLSANA
jgi:dihydrodipicolinate synthase/N-acetylneuraminate lyase